MSVSPSDVMNSFGSTAPGFWLCVELCIRIDIFTGVQCDLILLQKIGNKQVRLRLLWISLLVYFHQGGSHQISYVSYCLRREVYFGRVSYLYR